MNRPQQKTNVVCPGCGGSFVKKGKKKYHSRLCGSSHRAWLKKNPQLRNAGKPLEKRHLEPFMAFFAKKAPKDAIGYMLQSLEIPATLPGSRWLRRDHTKPEEAYYRLDPVEIPLIPFAGPYRVHWVFGPADERESKGTDFDIQITWTDEFSTRSSLAVLRKAYNRMKRRKRKELDQQLMANLQRATGPFIGGDSTTTKKRTKRLVAREVTTLALQAPNGLPEPLSRDDEGEN